MRNVVIISVVSVMSLGCATTEQFASDVSKEVQWVLKIEQDGKPYDPSGPIYLKKKPFEFVFSGDKRLNYAVISSIDCADISSLKSESEIAKVIRPTNRIVETSGRENRGLLVHNKGAIPSGDNGSQVWSEEPQYEIYSFQSYSVGANNIAIARREIREITLHSNFKDKTTYPVELFPSQKICALATGLLPVGRMAHTDPKYVEIHFK